MAVTPGRDFGHADTARFIRFSTASSMAQLQEAAARLQAAVEDLARAGATLPFDRWIGTGS